MSRANRERAKLGEDWRDYQPLPLSPILAAAQDAFYEKGFYGASVRDIANRVGLTVPALYYHHASKEGIFTALADIAIGDLTWRAQAAAAAALDPVERFTNVIAAIVGHMTERTKLSALDSEVRHLSAKGRRRYARQRKVVEQLLDSIVEEGVAASHFATRHPIDTARALLGMCQAIPIWYRPDGRLTSRQVRERYVGIALMAVGGATERPVDR